MTTRTLTIPPTTLPVGVTTIGPLAIGGNSHAGISIDRTTAGGLNSLTTDSYLDLMIQTSIDGTTWADLCGCGTAGGISSTAHGQINTTSVDTGDVPAAATQVHVIATVTGPSPINVAGTVTVT